MANGTIAVSSIEMLSQSGTGIVTINPPATNSNFTVSIPAGTGTAVVNGVNGALVSGTAVASTSGTAIDFTGIPSWVKRITVMFSGVSTSGTNGMQVQLGAGSVETSGYITTLSLIQSATPAANSSIVAGFPITFTGYVTAASTCQGAITISLLGSNTWCATSLLSREAAGNTLFQSAGAKTLSGTLDRVRITTFAGTDTFDAGTINILYE
jgi:hypothetical protein